MVQHHARRRSAVEEWEEKQVARRAEWAALAAAAAEAEAAARARESEEKAIADLEYHPNPLVQTVGCSSPVRNLKRISKRLEAQKEATEEHSNLLAHGATAPRRQHSLPARHYLLPDKYYTLANVCVAASM